MTGLLCPTSVAVHFVLVTDFLLVLTERDQKYHLAALQDLKVLCRMCGVSSLCSMTIQELRWHV